MDRSGQGRRHSPCNGSPFHAQNALQPEESSQTNSVSGPPPLLSLPSTTSVSLAKPIKGTAPFSDEAHEESMGNALLPAKSTPMMNNDVVALAENKYFAKSSASGAEQTTSILNTSSETTSEIFSTAQPIGSFHCHGSLDEATSSNPPNHNNFNIFTKTSGVQNRPSSGVIRHALLVGYKKMGQDGDSNLRDAGDCPKLSTSLHAKINIDEENFHLRPESYCESLASPSTIQTVRHLVVDDKEKIFSSDDQNNCIRDYPKYEKIQTSCESSFADAVACGSKTTIEDESSSHRDDWNSRNDSSVHKYYQSSAAIDGSECFNNLQPAPVPHDPINEEWEIASPLERELAWLVEESAFILSNALQNDKETKNSNNMGLPIILEFAWNHASLRLREQMLASFPDEVMTFLKDSRASSYVAFVAKKDNLDENRVLIDSLRLLPRKIDVSNTPAMTKQLTVSENVDSARFNRLLNEARNALVLGYRRNDSIDEVLGDIHKERWRDAVGEIGEPDIKRPRHRRTRRKRLQYTNKILSFGGDVSQYWNVMGKKGNDSLKSPEEIKAKNLEIARNKPLELTDCEEEMAWLCEESLILLGEDVIGGDSTFNGKISSSSTSSVGDGNVIVSETSAGLVTQAPDVNWNYVVEHASPALKKELHKRNVFSLQSRILKRIIRYHDSNVKNAFWKRRDEIAGIILIGGYRRPSTQNFLPSHDLLVQIGMAKIFTVRRMRWRSFQYDENASSSAELRSACNIRIRENNGHRKKNIVRKMPRKKGEKRPLHVDSLSQATNCSKSPKLITEKSILTAEEEEIAWLREEYEIETGGLKGFDWEYIEEFASPLLLDTMTRRGVTLSKFPTKPGVSKLLKMVRLNDPDVEKAFRQKRVDVRHAIVKKGFRRNLLSKKLPVIPKAPSVAAVFETQVFDVQVPADESSGKSTNISFTEKWQCDICHFAVFDTFEEAAEHEQQCSGGSQREVLDNYVWKCISCGKKIGENFDSIFNHERNCNGNISEDQR